MDVALRASKFYDCNERSYLSKGVGRTHTTFSFAKIGSWGFEDWCMIGLRLCAILYFLDSPQRIIS